jgi:dihydroflavonol-4-reductase
MVTVVTGAAGLLGANLVRALLARGRRVRALVHEDTRALQGLDVERAAGDVRDPEALRRAFAGAEVVYHAAARISVRGGEGGLVEAVNAGGTRNVVEACLGAGVRRLLHVSSVHALAPRPHGPIDESCAPAQGGPAYDRSKARGEEAVREGIRRGLDAVILRPSALFGPHDHKPSRTGELLLALYRRELPALVAGSHDFVDARDVARSALAAEARAPAGEAYLLTGHPASLGDIARLVEEATGRRPPRVTVPLWLARAVAPLGEAWALASRKRPFYTRESVRAIALFPTFSSAKAARDLGHAARPLRETIFDTLAWFAEMGWLR